HHRVNATARLVEYTVYKCPVKFWTVGGPDFRLAKSRRHCQFWAPVTFLCHEKEPTTQFLSYWTQSLFQCRPPHSALQRVMPRVFRAYRPEFRAASLPFRYAAPAEVLDNHQQ